jgi:hemoglobin
MALIVFYEKPGCGGNAKQRALLEAAGHTLDRRNLLATDWTSERLLAFLSERPVTQWFNRAAPSVKAREVVPEQLGRDEALALLVADPILIRRPLMQREDGATMVGFDPDEVDRFVGLNGRVRASTGPAGPSAVEGCAMSARPGSECSDGLSEHNPSRTGGAALEPEARHGSDGRAAPVDASPALACSLKEALRPTESVRTGPASHDLEFPPIPFPSLRVLRVAGESVLRALVVRHHERLRASAIGGLFPADDVAFARLIEKAVEFVQEACGGPAAYSSQHGFTCMRTRHLPFSIDEAARDGWLEALRLSFDDVGFPEEVREEYWNWLEAMSIRMITRRTIRGQPRRIPYAQMASSPPEEHQ